MRMIPFARRTAKEVLRDPLNVAFGVGFPLAVLLLLTAIQANIPVSLFELDRLTPGIAVFGLSFFTLFSGMLVAKDRSSALLQRLYTTPLTGSDYILGYLLPMIPIALAQSIICYAAAGVLGMEPVVQILYAIFLTVPAALFFLFLGLLCGSLFSDKLVGGLCGALLTNLAAWLSGTWFDLDLVGGAFRKVAYALPFVHAVELQRAVLSGSTGEILPHLGWVLGYALLMAFASVWAFTWKKKRG